MPERQPIHEQLCKALGISCLFISKWCPLDENYHDKHHHRRKYLIPFFGEFAINGTLDDDQCESFVMAHLKRLKNIVQDERLAVDLSNKGVRSCCTAHMAVDHASDYYWEAQAKFQNIPGRHKLRWLFKNDRCYYEFLLRITRRILDKDPLASDVSVLPQIEIGGETTVKSIDDCFPCL